MSIAPTAPGTLELAEEFGLSRDEYELILEKVGRPINATELGIFSVMWSEHCSYKSSRVHLAKFPTKAPHVIYGPGENAWRHRYRRRPRRHFQNGEPQPSQLHRTVSGRRNRGRRHFARRFHHGRAPGGDHGRVRFGDPEHPKTRRLVDGVVRGIAGYGNCVGVPTIGGETNFNARYNGNILVNVFCLGIAPRDRIFTAAAKGAGNPVVYVGAKTGRDGIHGATMASAEFDDDSQAQRPTVQVGDPFLEKLLIEACLELRPQTRRGHSGHGRGGPHLIVRRNGVKGEARRRTRSRQGARARRGHEPYEFMLSESQERMLMVLKPGREAEAKHIFEKWGLDAVVIGATTDTGRLTLRWRGQIVCDLPLAPLADEAPKYERPWVEPLKAIPLTDADAKRLIEDYPGFAPSLAALMTTPDMASKRWIWEQYDRHVMGDTLADSDGDSDAAIVRLYGRSGRWR